MKKLKDAAIHWADTQGTHPYSRLCAIDAFTDGGKWMREEMTRWHDPKEELPANDREVLCKIDGWAIKCIVLKYNNFGWWMPAPKYSGWCACAFNVLAWREIHE